MAECRYPEVQVELIGQDGNAFMILGNVKRALLKHGVDKDRVNEYLEEAMSGDYDNLLSITMSWVTVV